MELPKSTPDELIEDLRELAGDSYTLVFPNMEKDELIEMDAADFIASATAFLRDLEAAGGETGARAARILQRLE